MHVLYCIYLTIKGISLTWIVQYIKIQVLKHINTLCGQDAELLNIKLAVYKDPVRTAQ